MIPRLFPSFVLLSTGIALSIHAQADDSWPLSLSQAQSIARERNHDLKLSRFAVRGAQANVEIAGVAPNPVLTVQSASIRPGTGFGSGSLTNQAIDTTVRLDQLIERGGKRELRTSNARKLELAAQADSADVERQLDLLVAEAYADLHATQERRAAAIDSAQLFEAMLAAAQKRKEAGDIAGADVERVKVDALRAKNDIDAANGELARSRYSLALLLGENLRAGVIEAIDPWPALQAAELSDASNLEQIVAQRADVRAAMARLDAASAGRELALSLRTRDVSVGVQYEHFPQSGAIAQSSPHSVGISLQIPLFVRNYYKGEILSAEAGVDSASENLGKTREAAANEIERARGAVQSSAARVLRNRDELLVAAANAAKAAEFAYKNGAVGVMDVLDARRTLRATRLDALAALAEYSKALAHWRAATAANAATGVSSESTQQHPQ
ncbi:MAG: TolC family protein [Burkholderiaceae bacterium]